MARRSKRGRPRKHKLREPSGKGSRAEIARQMKAFAKWQRRHLDIEDPLSERAGYPLGLLTLQGRLTEQQHSAGIRYQSVVRSYRFTMGLALANVSAIDLGTIPGRELEDEPDPDAIARIKRRYEEAQLVLLDCGQAATYTCHEVCVREHMVPAAMVDPLKYGLTQLAQYFRIDPEAASA